MTAVLGWVGVPCPDQSNASELLERMIGSSWAQRDFQISQGGQAFVAAHRYHGKLVCSRASGWHVLLLGSAQSTEPELQRQIQERGVGPALVERFIASGSDFLSTLNGHFVLAMACEDGNQALLAVDRFCVDPMSYAQSGQGLVFASKPTWVNRHPAVQGEINPQSIFNYLYFHMIPGPGTLFTGVSKLQPGCCVQLSPEGLEVTRYWSPDFHNEQGSIPAQYSQQFLDRIRDGVEASIDDVDATGCFLSGGTDSSTIAGMFGQVTGQPAKTFSIGFASQGFDETEYARIAAKHFATDHHEYYVTPEDVVSAVPKIAAAYGEPFGNSSVVPTYYCAKLAREHGVQRLLGGDGGDELFGGNERYAKQLLFSVYDNVPNPLKRGLFEPLFLSKMGKKLPVVRKFSSYVDQARQRMPDRMETYNLLTRLGLDTVVEQEFLESIDRNQPLSLIRKVYEEVNTVSMLNRMLATDFKFTLADNDLPKVKVMCELAEVDVGFPLLDSGLVNLSLGLPDDGKIRRLRLRHFFKQSLKGFLPDAILSKSKHGFGLPFGPWLLEHKALRELAFDALADFKRRRILSTKLLDELVTRRIDEHAGYYGNLVWVIMMLEHWLAAQELSVRVNRQS